MLANLPLDVIIRIARLLSFENKVNLMQTCLKFCNLIQATCLYESISLISSREEIEKRITTFRKEKHMGKQTRHLTIDLDVLSNQMYSQLPSIFPNVVELQAVLNNEEEREQAILNKFIKWKDTLKFLSEEDGHLHTFSLLEKNVYPNLIKLELSTSAFEDSTLHNSHINILKCIQNAPLLGILNLSECKITLAFLESVHSACPRLFEFSVTDCIITTENEAYPDVLLPAAHMVQFEVSRTLIVDRGFLFLRYLAHKYTQLSTLDISPAVNCSHFLHYFNDEGERENVRSVLNVGHDATRDLYLQEGLATLSNISSVLKSLSLNSRYFDGMSSVLNKGYALLTTLSVLDGDEKSVLFKNSNQLSLLHDLPSLKTLTFAFNSLLQEYGYNVASNTVTEINVAVQGTSLLDDLDVCWILSVFPSLQKIFIEYSNARLVCYQDQVSDVFPSVSSVDFGVSVIHPELFRTLYKLTPNIRQLGLTVYGPELVESIQETVGPSILTLTETPMQTKARPVQKQYTIDLNDCDLETFNLKVKVNYEASNKKGFILFVNSRYFIVEQHLSRISSERYYLGDEYEYLDQINIHATHTKEIVIDSQIVVDTILGSIRFVQYND